MACHVRPTTNGHGEPCPYIGGEFMSLERQKEIKRRRKRREERDREAKKTAIAASTAKK